MAKYENKDTQLNSFEKLRGKIRNEVQRQAKEAIIPDKSQNHLNWSKSVKEGQRL